MASIAQKLVLGVLGGGGESIPPQKTFWDDFRNGGVVSPRTCVPGSGSWNITQTQGLIEIVNKQLEITAAAGSPQTNTMLASVASYAKQSGMCLYFERVSGVAEGAVGLFSGGLGATPSNLYVNFNTGVICGFSGSGCSQRGLYSAYRIIVGDTTVKWLGYDGTNWHFLFHYPTAPLTAYYPTIFQGYSTTKNVIDNIYVEYLGVPWRGDYDIATAYVASPSTGETVTADADGFYHVSWRAATGETLTILFRRTDDDNCLKLVCTQADGTIKLYKREAGSDTELNAGKTQTWTNGSTYQIGITTRGTIVQSAVNTVLKHNTTSTYNQAETGVKISGFTTLTNLACFPDICPPFDLPPC